MTLAAEEDLCTAVGKPLGYRRIFRAYHGHHAREHSEQSSRSCHRDRCVIGEAMQEFLAAEARGSTGGKKYASDWTGDFAAAALRHAPVATFSRSRGFSTGGVSQGGSAACEPACR